MGLWLALGLMTLFAVGLVVAPLVRRAGLVASRRDYDLRVYRAQLAELTREQERGVLGEREAEAARLEVERRMLAADAADRQARQAPARSGRNWASAAVLLVGLPALAGGLYWQLGSPDRPAAPFAGRAGERARLAAAQERQQEVLRSLEPMIARLETRLASDPDDLEASLHLGRAYALAGQFERAAGTYRAAIARHEGVAELHSALGEVLVMASGGTVGEEARAAFDQALKIEAGDVRARFYAGLAMLQRGERQGALDAWVGLLEDAPADAPWLPDLRQRTAALAQDLGLDPERVLAASRPAAGEPGIERADGAGQRGPSAAQMRAAEAMSPAERQKMIRGMVDGLAARLEQQPEDVEGWRMLGRSWAALGQAAKSAEAYRQVASRLPEDVTAQVDYAEALLAQQGMDQPPSAKVVAQLQQVLALDADNPIALFHLGRAAAARGDTTAAARHWRRLLAQMPADAPVRPQLERLLENLRADD
jgi:cytochrome c-type biogenesis protein CcmH